MTVQRFVKQVVGTAALALAATAVTASAQMIPYVSVGGDVQHRQRAAEDSATYTDWKMGPGVNVAAGVEAKGGLAVEGEYTYFRNSSKTTAAPATGPQPGVGYVNLNMFFANVRYTMPTKGPVALYVGGGAGAYKSSLQGLSNTVAQSFGFVANGSNDGLVFAYQARVGASVKVSKHIAVLAGYRYVHGNDLLFKGTAFGDLTPNGAKMHALDVNLKVNF